MNQILFICSGNTCRSPMAEGIMSALSAGKNISASSVGLSALPGMPASPFAINAAAKYGADLSNHFSKQLTEEMCGNADVIYCMTEGHRQSLYRMYPNLKTHAYVFWPEVPDPYGGDESVYFAAAENIEKNCRSILDTLEKFQGL